MRGRPPIIRDEEILDAARDVFRAEGHATTTAKIAKRARVSEGILFYRYQSKEALLAAVIRRETQPPEALREIVKNAGRRSLRENLERIVETLLESLSRAHPFLELAITSSTSGEIHKLLFAQGSKPPPQQIVELLKGYFEDESRAGRARAIDANAAARGSLAAASITCGPGKGRVTLRGGPSCGAWLTCSRTAPSRRLPRDDKGERRATHEGNFLHPLFEESLNNVCLPVPPACASRGHAGQSRPRRLRGRPELSQAGARRPRHVEPD